MDDLLIRLEATFILFSNKNFVWNHTLLDSLKSIENFITKLRVNNIKFPIETGRWRNINREHRICQKCSLSLIGDEFHCLFVCNCHDILELRNKYIPNYFTTNASFYINIYKARQWFIPISLKC